MKKQEKQFLVMLFLLVVFVILFVVLTFYNKKQDQKEEEENQTKPLFDVTAEDITAFSYYYDGTLHEFRRGDGQWYYAPDPTISLNQDSLENMASSLAEMEVAKEVENPGELSEYGLDTPNNTITIMTESRAYVVLLGNYNAFCGQYYIKLEYSDTVYLTNTNYEELLMISPADLTDMEIEALDDTESVGDADSAGGTEVIYSTEE